MAVGLINIKKQPKIVRIADRDDYRLKLCESQVVRPRTGPTIEGNRCAGSVVALFNRVVLNAQERLDDAGAGRLLSGEIKNGAVDRAAVAMNQVNDRGL